MLPKNLILLRHGESEGNVAFKKEISPAMLQGFRKKHPSIWRLTDRGIWQAQTAGKWIRNNIDFRFERYYVSEYHRALETAFNLNLQGAIWYPEIYLREREWGDIDGLPREERLEISPNSIDLKRDEPFLWTPPNGESIATLCLRIDRILDTLHRECSKMNVIIVAHGETMWGFRIRLEKISQKLYKELDASDHPFDRIHNCQIIHYTRINPTTGKESPYFGWMRSICSSDTELSSNSWKKIIRPKFVNDDLEAIFSKTPQIIK